MAREDTEPGEFLEADLHSSRIDQHKAQIDVLKHVATLDTGALLVVVALVEKVFPAPHAKPVIGAAVICLLISLAASGFACLSVLAAFPRSGARRMDREGRRDRALTMLATFLGFFFGVLLIAIFFVANWF